MGQVSLLIQLVQNHQRRATKFEMNASVTSAQPFQQASPQLVKTHLGNEMAALDMSCDPLRLMLCIGKNELETIRTAQTLENVEQRMKKARQRKEQPKDTRKNSRDACQCSFSPAPIYSAAKDKIKPTTAQNNVFAQWALAHNLFAKIEHMEHFCKSRVNTNVKESWKM